MLSIGEFANATGVTIKALRHYGEKGVLVPVDVDPRSGYRRYSEAQVRLGVVARALRDAGVPLPALEVALRDGDGDAGAALDEYRARVTAERAREDAAFENAELVLSSLAAAVQVNERSCPAQPYVARVISVAADGEDGAGDEEANEQFAALLAALQADGFGPSGAFWTGLRQGADPGTAEVRCCWPTLRRVPLGWGGDFTIVDELPKRRELVARWHSRDGVRLPEKSVHPAVVALFDAIADRDIQVVSTEVRQTVDGQDENDYTVEVAVTIAPE